MYSIGICKTKKNVFYSAYLKSRVQFNDIDPDKNLELIGNDEETPINDEKKDEPISNDSVVVEGV